MISLTKSSHAKDCLFIPFRVGPQRGKASKPLLTWHRATLIQESGDEGQHWKAGTSPLSGTFGIQHTLISSSFLLKMYTAHRT